MFFKGPKITDLECEQCAYTARGFLEVFPAANCLVAVTNHFSLWNQFTCVAGWLVAVKCSKYFQLRICFFPSLIYPCIGCLGLWPTSVKNGKIVWKLSCPPPSLFTLQYPASTQDSQTTCVMGNHNGNACRRKKGWVSMGQMIAHPVLGQCSSIIIQMKFRAWHLDCA